MRVSWTDIMDHREHQTGMDTGVKGAKGSFGHVVKQEGWKMA